MWKRAGWNKGYSHLSPACSHPSISHLSITLNPCWQYGVVVIYLILSAIYFNIYTLIEGTEHFYLWIWRHGFLYISCILWSHCWMTDSCANFSWNLENLTPILSFFWSTDTILGPKEFRDVANFSTFLLDQSSGMLYLGAKDAILAVDTNKPNQPPQMVGRVCASLGVISFLIFF